MKLQVLVTDAPCPRMVEIDAIAVRTYDAITSCLAYPELMDEGSLRWLLGRVEELRRQIAASGLADRPDLGLAVIESVSALLGGALAQSRTS